LVQRLFSSITEMVEEEDTFVIVLIGEFNIDNNTDKLKSILTDEVESLTAARAGALAGTEPSDGLRVTSFILSLKPALKMMFLKVVNALLTQLDKLKHKKNVLIMSTSNLVKAIGASRFFCLR
jgi:hypothetical protein